MPFFDQRLHITEEKSQQQRPDMAAIHISIAHHDNPSITQPGQIETLTNPGAQCRNQGLYFVVCQDFIQAGTFRIQDFPSQRQNRLEMPVSALFGAAACRVTLNDVQFGLSEDLVPNNLPIFLEGSGFPVPIFG